MSTDTGPTTADKKPGNGLNNPFSQQYIPKQSTSQANDDSLRNPWLAGLLAWLIPGAGHFYQGRWAKGALISVCILGTFCYGIMLGSSRTVYASFRPHEPRMMVYFPGQLGVGLPVLPAIIQNWQMKQNGAPLWNGFMAPPVLIGQKVPSDWAIEQMRIGPDAGDFKPGDFQESTEPGYHVYVAPSNPNVPNFIPSAPTNNDTCRNQYSVWNAKLDFKYELGTLFTLVAGLLNIIVVFDAINGPALGRDWSEFSTKMKRIKELLEQDAADKKRAKAKPKASP